MLANMLQVHRWVAKGRLTKYAVQYFRANTIPKQVQQWYWERAVLRKKLPARFTEYLPAECDVTGVLSPVSYQHWGKPAHRMGEQEVREFFYMVDVASILKEMRRTGHRPEVDTRKLFYEWVDGVIQ